MPRKPRDPAGPRGPDLKVIRLPGRGRPPPPDELGEAERKVWRAVVDSSPDGYLDGAGQLILAQVCTQLAIAQRMSQRIDALLESRADNLETEIALGRAHGERLKTIAAGMRELRATPRSRMASRNARTAFEAAPTGRRPWDPPPVIDQDDEDGAAS